MKDLFIAHIKNRVRQTRDILEEQNIDHLFIESGFPDLYYLDDQPTFFKSNPHFLFYCPDQGQGHILKISKNEEKPKLYFHIPDDFWHEVSALKGEFWEDSFDIKVFNNVEKAWKEAASPNSSSVISSSEPSLAVQFGCKIADTTLLSKLHWLRNQKTDYEINCLRLANEAAAKGHNRARELFLQGASEWQIFMEYLIASGQRETELPYNSIVALDDNSAVLHYQFPKKRLSGNTFLIDAGARYNGYCSDITRTYVQNSVNSVYKEILQKVDDNQSKLCEMVKPGVEYVDIHRTSYEMVADLLIDFNIFNGTKDEAIANRIPFHFYPHGIGHPLGLQVHDVGAKQANPEGATVKQPEDFPHLRTLRTIQENDVLTIEPGFYFIPLLLKPLRENNKTGSLFNWDLIDSLIPYGGIRIEDNIVATISGPKNLTRTFLP